jgi:hypothetical protein
LRRRVSTWLVAGLGLLAAAACTDDNSPVAARPTPSSSFATAPAPGVAYQLPNNGWRPGQPAFAALSTGRFHAWWTPAGACAGLGKAAVTMLWPEQYAVRFSPTRLVDADGRVVAREGDVIDVGGGLLPAPKGVRCLNGAKDTFSVMSGVRVRHSRG